MEALRSAPTHDLTKVVGQVGELRTAIDPTGSAYIAGELWTVTARGEVPVGSKVKVVGREGLILVVEPEK
jgi:membrane-bound serine protease (ClpP class)